MTIHDIGNQPDHLLCSALVDTGYPVTLLSKKIQRQLNLPATPLKSHYNLVGATGDALTTLGTVQVDIASDSKIWITPAIVMSSLAHSLILGLNFLKLTKSQIDFNTNNVEIRSKIHQPCRLTLNKKACWMIAIMLTTVIILTAVASHTHCHFNHTFKEQNKPIFSPAHNLTCKELLAYGNTVRLKIMLQAARSDKTGQLYFLE